MRIFLNLMSMFVIIIVHATSIVGQTTGDGTTLPFYQDIVATPVNNKQAHVIPHDKDFERNLSNYKMDMDEKDFFLSYHPENYNAYKKNLLKVCTMCNKYEQQEWFMFSSSTEFFKDMRLKCKTVNDLNTVLDNILVEFDALKYFSKLNLYACLLLNDNSIKTVKGVFKKYFEENTPNKHPFTIEHYKDLQPKSVISPVSDECFSFWEDSLSNHSDCDDIKPKEIKIEDNLLLELDKKLHASIHKALIKVLRHTEHHNINEVKNEFSNSFSEITAKIASIKVFFRRKNTVAWIVLILNESLTHNPPLLDQCDPHVSLLKLVVSDKSAFEDFDKAKIIDYVKTANDRLASELSSITLTFDELIVKNRR